MADSQAMGKNSDIGNVLNCEFMGNHNKGIGGLVMAGGNSSRMGRDKAAIHPYGRDKPCFLRMAFDLLEKVVTPCFVSCAKGRAYAGYPCLEDSLENCGPAAGIAQGLQFAMQNNLSGLLVVACDLPLLDEEHLLRLLRHHANSLQNTIASVYRNAQTQKPEMLAAIYTTRALPLLQTALARRERALKLILPAERINFLLYDGKEAPAFLNCNTEEDLRKLTEFR